ncbi:hypothetical protein D3C79_954750 [compost metagenome]
MVDWLRQACGDPLHSPDRIMPGHRKALMHSLQRSLTSVWAVLHCFGIGVEGRYSAEGFVVVARFFSCRLQHRAQARKRSLNSQRLLLIRQARLGYFTQRSNGQRRRERSIVPHRVQ